MVIGRPLAGRLTVRAGRPQRRRAPGCPTTTSISPTRRASSPRRSGRCRRAKATSKGTRARCASLGVAGYYNLVPTDVRRAHRRSDAPTPTTTATAASTTSRSGRGASSCARSGAAPRCRPSGSAATRMPGRRRTRRAATGAPTSQASYFVHPAAGCRSRRASGSTDLPLYGVDRRRSARCSATASTSRAPPSTPTCAASGSRSRSTTRTSTPSTRRRAWTRLRPERAPRAGGRPARVLTVRVR